jgi:hypothetical protein
VDYPLARKVEDAASQKKPISARIPRPGGLLSILFPVMIDDAVIEKKTGWAADIRRSRHIGDFRNWKNHDDYQRAFQRLLCDLRTEQEPPASKL